MSEQLFTASALLAAKVYWYEEIDENKIIRELVENYQNAFKDELNLLDDMHNAGKKILKFLNTNHPDKDLESVFKQLEFLNQNYEINGKKRKRKLLGGTWFNYEKKYNKDRAELCLASVFIYYQGSISGMFPLIDS